VAFFAFVPLLRALEGAARAGSFRLGYAAGVVGSLGILYWTALVVAQFGAQGLPVGIGAMLLLCLAVGAFPASAAWLTGRCIRRFGRSGLLIWPVAWVATELVRDRTVFRFPWCLLGYSQVDVLPYAQLASLGGVYLVSFWVAGTGAVLAWAIGEPRLPRRRLGLTSLALAHLLALGFGFSRLGTEVASGGSLKVALVQPSIPQDEKWRPDLLAENLFEHEQLSRSEAVAGARLVVWPESAVPFPFDSDRVAASRLAELARAGDHYLLFGNDDFAGHGEEARIWVGAKLLDPAGRLAMRYHKIRLVPFGEYVPLEPLLTLGGAFAGKLVDRVGRFTPGEELTLGEVDGHRLGTLICYEAIFPDLSRGFTEEGAELLVNVTNDAWYGTTSAPYQHFAMARMRAIETGLYLVRAANTGISGVVDPRGRALARTPLFEERVLVEDVPISTERTLYAATGDAFAWTCLAAAIVLVLATRRPAARNQSSVISHQVLPRD
jgi:apolipoprotein N-acyltransferase